jgi:hypothetical protein
LAAILSHRVVMGDAVRNLWRELQFMIQEYAQRIYGAAAVCLWVVVVSVFFGMILASTVNGGISW